MLVFELIENIIVQDTSSRRVEEDKKNLKEKKEYKKKYLSSKLESYQQSLKRYKLAGNLIITRKNMSEYFQLKKTFINL